jgi:transposase
MGRHQVASAQQAAWPARYDKLAANYLAIINLASIRIWLRANESAD